MKSIVFGIKESTKYESIKDSSNYEAYERMQSFCYHAAVYWKSAILEDCHERLYCIEIDGYCPKVVRDKFKNLCFNEYKWVNGELKDLKLEVE